MAKIAFTKLGLKKKDEVKTVNINNNVIEVKQYLPINEKLELIGRVLNQAADDNNFSNPIKLEVFTALEIVFTYTNIGFTDKQKEDLIKLYDILESNNIFNLIIAELPEAEYNALIDGVQKCSDAIYTYRNSVLGILDVIGQDYADLDLNATNIQQKLADPENLELLKSIMTRLG